MPGRWLMVAGMVATVCLIVALLFSQDRAREQNALIAARSKIQHDTLRIAAQIDQVLDASDRLALFMVSDILAIIDAPVPTHQPGEWWQDARLLGDRPAFLPWLSGAAIVDAQGYIRRTTKPQPLATLSIVDRPYFQTLKQGQEIAFDVERGKNDAVTTLILARPLLSEDGQFFGAVILALRAQALSDILEQTGYDRSASVHLTLADGSIIARAGNLAPPASATVPNSDIMVVEHDLAQNRQLFSLPLVVRVSHSVEEIHARFWTDRLSSILIGLVLSVFAVALTLLTLRWLGDRDRMMAALERARQAAEAANRDKDGILALVAHELRTPLNAIIGFTELIESEIYGPLGAPEYNEYLQHVRSGASHMQEMIGAILDFSKLRAGRMTLTMEPVDLAGAARSVHGLLAALALRSDIMLILAGPMPEDCYVLADPAATRQMVTNLVSNAIKFTPTKGSVTLSLQAEADQVLLTVRDTGVGMDPEEIRVAMEPFGQNRTAQIRSASGTGLGLPMVIGLIELHGGRLLINSIKGQGTSMTLVFPRRPAGGGVADYSPTLPISKNFDRRSDFN